MSKSEIAINRTEANQESCLPLIAVYADHSPLIDDLNILYGTYFDRLGILGQSSFASLPRHNLSAGVVGEYLKGVEQIAGKHGLDRLPPVDTTSDQSIGFELIHGYCMNLRYCEEAGVDWSARSMFISAAPVSFMASESHIHHASLQLDLEWDPVNESLADAQSRVKNAATGKINALLREIANQVEHEGLTFGERAPRDRDIKWLFRKMALKESYQQIAEDESEDREMIQKAVIRAADRLGVDRAGW